MPKKATGVKSPKAPKPPKEKPAAKNASEPKKPAARASKAVPPDVKLTGRVTNVGAAVKEKTSEEGFVKPEAVMRVTFECKMRPELMSAVSALALEHVTIELSAVQTSLPLSGKSGDGKKSETKEDVPSPTKTDAAKNAGDAPPAATQLDIPE